MEREKDFERLVRRQRLKSFLFFPGIWKNIKQKVTGQIRKQKLYQTAQTRLEKLSQFIY